MFYKQLQIANLLHVCVPAGMEYLNTHTRTLGSTGSYTAQASLSRTHTNTHLWRNNDSQLEATNRLECRMEIRLWTIKSTCSKKAVNTYTNKSKQTAHMMFCLKKCLWWRDNKSTQYFRRAAVDTTLTWEKQPNVALLSWLEQRLAEPTFYSELYAGWFCVFLKIQCSSFPKEQSPSAINNRGF